MANKRMNFHKNEQRFCIDCGHSGSNTNQLLYNTKIIKSKREKNIIKFCTRCNSIKKDGIEKSIALEKTDKHSITGVHTLKSVKLIDKTEQRDKVIGKITMTHQKSNLRKTQLEVSKKQSGKIKKKKVEKIKEKTSFGLSSFL